LYTKCRAVCKYNPRNGRFNPSASPAVAANALDAVQWRSLRLMVGCFCTPVQLREKLLFAVMEHFFVYN